MSDIPTAKTYLGFALLWDAVIIVVSMLCFILFSAGYVITGILAVLLTGYGIYRHSRAIGRRARQRSKGRTFLGISIILALFVLLNLAVDGLLYFNPYYTLCGLIALSLLLRAATTIARRRGWGSEGRFTRFLNRPRFVDESRRSDY